MTLQVLSPSLSGTLTVMLFTLIISLRRRIVVSGTPEAYWGWALTALSLLTVFLISATQARSLTQLNKNWYTGLITAMALSLVGCFFVDNVLFFYVLFEASALVVFFFILRFGYQPERFTASAYLLLFTALSSLPFIFIILTMGSEFSVLTFDLIKIRRRFGRSELRGLLILALTIGFLVKFPIYLFHIWLPKAHVEASRRGSMLLAGILLKLGAYGVFRLRSILQGGQLIRFIIFFRILGGGLLSAMCCRFVDFKVLIAYSSVAHMRLVIGGIMSLSKLGRESSLGMSLGHGVISSGLFFGAGLLYASTNRRLFLFNKRTMNWAPWFTFFWFILCASNMGTPPTFNFWIELLLLFTLVSFRWSSVVVLVSSLFFGVVFNVVLYIMAHGAKPSYPSSFYLRLSLKDLSILMAHIILRIYLIFRFGFK